MLLPCPQCSYENIELLHASTGFAYIKCQTCGIHTTQGVIHEVVTLWNQRTLRQHKNACPCCGEKAQLCVGGGIWFIMCPECLVSTRNARSQDEAWSLWHDEFKPVIEESLQWQ